MGTYDKFRFIYRSMFCSGRIGCCIQPFSSLWGGGSGCGVYCGMWVTGKFRGFFCIFGTGDGVFRGDVGGVCLFGFVSS